MSLVIDGDLNTITKNTAAISVNHTFTIPTGTTAQRPTSPIAGMIRFNTQRGFLEGYDGTNWVRIL